MFQTKRFLYIGLMCHQTIEKSLKGYYVFRKPNEELPFLHRLIKLANLSGLSAEMTEEQLLFLERLSPLNIEARYPAYREDLTKVLSDKVCLSLLRETEEFMQWIKTRCC